MAELDRKLAAFYLGLLDDESQAQTERAVRSDVDLRRRHAAWPTVIAAITVGALVSDDESVEGRLEQRLIQRARVVRPAQTHSYQLLYQASRRARWFLLAGLVALASVFGALAFTPDDPISGRALPLTEDGATGVLMPRYESRLFALIFWGLPEIDETQTWQIWLVRESGAVEPGPTFLGDHEGRAAVTIDPNLIERGDALIGFAVSRDDPSLRGNGAASSEDILYQFPRE
ncbi:MAG: hypothetical protein F4Z51_04780 [Chloroflexi bacterium]|nr:hypothetical protein [Chloroflexota bacterium]MYD16892.1 hypothetical protein [Chloroflexota bacterium]MYJ02085.1 hypothetical protein [Chloroflexota bacterium]